MSKYTNFSCWIDDVLDKFQISSGDVKSSYTEYYITLGNDLVAYWDRKYSFGYIDSQ